MVNRACWGNVLHHFTATTKSADWHTATDHFTKCRQIGFDVVVRLSAAQCDTKTSHHFIENQ
ncbi:Uncharacterised protein [Vibrio cholerae]|nr:Uncharacterised protein [Vibrio cholerae]